nr:unnamed protein product [Digitaria exilis]
MASPQPLLLRPRPPACLCRCPCRSGSPYLHLSKKSLQALRPPRRCLQPVATLVSRPPGTGRRTVATGTFVCRCSYDTKNGLPTPPPDKEKSLAKWPVLRRWDVPWEWPTISLTMVACAVSFLLTGMIEQSILEQLGFQVGEATLDEKAEVLFLGQLYGSKFLPLYYRIHYILRNLTFSLLIICINISLVFPVFCKHSSTTVVVLGVIFGITNTFRPFSDDIFRYKFEEPFKLQNGWLLWAGIGLIVAIIAIALAGAAMTFLSGETPQRENGISTLVIHFLNFFQTDSLIILLPLIGSSGIRTACLLGITGVLAPILEETVFRGFLMVSLTMW